MAYELNERVKELRTQMKLSQIDFCALLGIKQGTLSDIERKRINVSTKTIEKIVNNLNVSKEWIYTGNGFVFKTKNDNVKYGIEIQLYNTVNRDYSQTNNETIKVVSFWKKLLDKNENLSDAFNALNDLQGLSYDLNDYIRRLNSITNEIDNDIVQADQKKLLSEKFVNECLDKLSVLRSHYKEITELNSAIESVLAFVDHHATGQIIG